MSNGKGNDNGNDIGNDDEDEDDDDDDDDNNYDDNDDDDDDNNNIYSIHRILLPCLLNFTSCCHCCLNFPYGPSGALRNYKQF